MAEFDVFPRASTAVSPMAAGIAPPRLPRLTPEHVRALNALHRPRLPLPLTLGGRELHLECEWESESRYPTIAMGVSIDGASAVLHLTPESLTALTAHLPLTGSLAECPPDLRALWLEYALLEWIEPLEERLGATIQLLDDAPALDDASAIRLSLRLEVDGSAARMALALGAEALRAVSPLLDELGPPVARPVPALPMPVQWIAGYQDLRLAELRGLAPGDVVLLERPAMSVAISGRLMIEVSEAAGGLRPLAPPGGGQGVDLATSRMFLNNDNHHWNHRSRDDMAEDSRKPASPRAEEAALDGLPVRLVCELGRLELSLGELRELGPGSVLPLSRPAEDAVDLVVNGRYLGRGRLVEIGDSLGVQIVGLAGDE